MFVNVCGGSVPTEIYHYLPVFSDVDKEGVQLAPIHKAYCLPVLWVILTCHEANYGRDIREHLTMFSKFEELKEESSVQRVNKNSARTVYCEPLCYRPACRRQSLVLSYCEQQLKRSRIHQWSWCSTFDMSSLSSQKSEFLALVAAEILWMFGLQHQYHAGSFPQP